MTEALFDHGDLNHDLILAEQGELTEESEKPEPKPYDGPIPAGLDGWPNGWKW